MRREKPSFTLVPQKPLETDPKDTSSETKKMTGYPDIAAVAAAAPSNASEIATPRGAGGKTVTPRAARATEEKKKEEEKAKLVEEALSKVGVEMMKELASLPYEAWAFFFSDPLLKLTLEETKTLADSYFLIAKALKPEEMASWKILLALACLQNTRIVLKKLAESKKREEAMKKMHSGETDGQDASVTII